MLVFMVFRENSKLPDKLVEVLAELGDKRQPPSDGRAELIQQLRKE